MSEQFDVVVIGGGPAGSSTANLLAQSGRRVVVLEKDRFPRFHVGESLLPRSLPVLERLGVTDRLDAEYLRKLGARFCDSATGGVMHYAFSEALEPERTHAYQVPRAAFDEMLLRTAAGRGAEVREGWRVERIRTEGERAVGVDATDPEGRAVGIAARFVVDASGRDTVLATKGKTKQRIPGLDKSGFYGHWEDVWRQEGEDEGNIQIVVFEHGWFWFIPFRGRRTSVGAVVANSYARTKRSDETLEAFFERTVALSSFASEWLAEARRVSPVSATADFSYRVRDLVGPGWVLVGDAGGFIDPLFSSGVHLALVQAELAAKAIEAALAADDDGAAHFAEYVEASRFGAGQFLGVVQAFYAGEFRETLFSPDQRPLLRKIITSLLSGDVFNRSATWARFVAEKYPARL